MAGLGETCTHVSALLFYIEATVRIRNQKTATESPAYWKMPQSLKKVNFKLAQDIDFSSSKKKKRTLDALVDCDTPSTSKSMKNKIDTPKPSDSEFSDFLSKLFHNNEQTAVLKVSKKYSKEFIPKSLSDDIPVFFSNLFDPSLSQATLCELKNIIESNCLNITVNKNQVRAVEEATRGQANNNLWFNLRTGRITASIMKSACRTDINKPSLALLKSICHPMPFENE